jgi:hypothetical protein
MPLYEVKDYPQAEQAFKVLLVYYLGEMRPSRWSRVPHDSRFRGNDEMLTPRSDKNFGNRYRSAIRSGDGIRLPSCFDYTLV